MRIDTHSASNGISRNSFKNWWLRKFLACAATVLAGFFSLECAAQVVVANAGPDRTIADTDGLPGEDVTLDGSASVDPQLITAYAWVDVQGAQVATGVQPTVRLSNGVNQITLVVSYLVDNGDGGTRPETTSDQVTITVQASQAPVADAGGDRSVADNDGLPGESVTLDASASTDADGSIVSYQWFLGGDTLLGTGAVLTDVQLPDGSNQITLLVSDNSGIVSSTSIVIDIGQASAALAGLADLAGLNANQRSVALAFDSLCTRLSQSGQETITAEQRDFLSRCNGILFSEDENEQRTALDQIGARELDGVRSQALVFATMQNSNVMDRMIALRGGANGLDLSGIALTANGVGIPLASLAKYGRAALGGSAGADDAANSLLNDRLGLWLRGNFGRGEKSASAANNGFESDQWGLTGGADYRFTDRMVFGVSLGLGQSNLDFNPNGRGGLDTRSWTASLYGSSFIFGNFYVDAVLNYGRANYDSDRHINYEESGTVIDRHAKGSTSGDTLSFAAATGYDFAWNGFTFSPNIGYLYIDTRVDEFSESGASGLDLAYYDQQHRSASLNGGGRLSYAWKLRWGVLLPHFRGQFVRELDDDVEVFGVRFAHDPFADSADPTPPIVVRADAPDQSYWRLAGGVSAQFKYGLSGYVEYQRLEGFEHVNFQDMTVGVRFQRALP